MSHARGSSPRSKSRVHDLYVALPGLVGDDQLSHYRIPTSADSVGQVTSVPLGSPLSCLWSHRRDHLTWQDPQ